MITKETIVNKKLDECFIKGVHDSGLTVLVCPKPKFATSYAIFGTRYGSIDTRFRIKGETEFADVPEGIAHYLEHKLFESEDGDAFDRFSKTGGYANAYTSFDRTCYLFSCTSKFDQNLDILLDFVRHPYFTEETVQKEQGIIGQEIRMYDDDPNWCSFFNLLCSLYREHPVRIDIAGTVESIAEINADLLYRCYRTFYNPSNMFICVAGPVDADSIFAKVDKVLDGVKGVEIERGTFTEPDGVLRERFETEMPISIPMFSIGYKELCPVPVKSLKEQIETDLALEMIIGKSSHLFNDLREQGLINDEFGASYFTGHGFAVELFEGESVDPDRVADAIHAEIERIRSEGIDEEEFTRAKNALYGRFIMMYNSVERIATALTSCAMDGTGLFDSADICADITPEDISCRIKEQFDISRRAISVVRPTKQ